MFFAKVVFSVSHIHYMKNCIKCHLVKSLRIFFLFPTNPSSRQGWQVMIGCYADFLTAKLSNAFLEVATFR